MLGYGQGRMLSREVGGSFPRGYSPLLAKQSYVSVQLSEPEGGEQDSCLQQGLCNESSVQPTLGITQSQLDSPHILGSP